MECEEIEAYNLSTYCTDASKTDAEAEICFPEDIRSFSTLAAIWCLVNAFVGFSGNLLTILAIPFAAKRKK